VFCEDNGDVVIQLTYSTESGMLPLQELPTCQVDFMACTYGSFTARWLTGLQLAACARCSLLSRTRCSWGKPRLLWLSQRPPECILFFLSLRVKFCYFLQRRTGVITGYCTKSSISLRILYYIILYYIIILYILYYIFTNEMQSLRKIQS
jgi:hypothetical protein